MVIDSFPFHNELDILRIRLEELKDVVDYHVLVECSHTQSRLSKPFYYQENKNLFEDFKDKIIDIQVDDYKEGGEANWSQEIFVRENITNGLVKLEKILGKIIQDNDYIIISDLDEIPMASKLQEVINESFYSPVSLNHYFISYFYNLYCPYRGWWGSVVADMKSIRSGWTPQYLRNQKDYLQHKGDWTNEFCGWHFSSCTDFDGLWNKWHNNIEPHDKSFLKQPGAKENYKKLFESIVVENKRFFYCDDILRDDIHMEVLPLDKLPIYMQRHLDDYKDLLIPTQHEQLQLL